jgi:hypothetical protein
MYKGPRKISCKCSGSIPRIAVKAVSHIFCGSVQCPYTFKFLALQPYCLKDSLVAFTVLNILGTTCYLRYCFVVIGSESFFSTLVSGKED